MQEQIVIKSDNSIQLTAPVMIPGARDCDFLRGEIPFTVEQVKASKKSMTSMDLLINTMPYVMRTQQINPN